MKKSLLLMLCFFAFQNAKSQTIFISELHYDNIGTDTLEGVEIAGPSGTDLSCFELQFYNGSPTSLTDDVYLTTPLSGTIDNEGAGYGAVWFSIPNLQNGSPDGVALVSTGAAGCPAAGVIQFLSYEGVMNGVDVQGGAAAGISSVDIGVQEVSSPVNTSLQLQGSGTTYSDFTWADSLTASPGSINIGMSFGIPTTGNVCGTIYEDFNENDVLDAGETGYAAATVTLILFGPDGTFGTADDVAVDTMMTSASGAYCFTNITPGVYLVQLDSIANYNSSYMTDTFSVSAGSNINGTNIGIVSSVLSIPELSFTTSSLTFNENAGTISVNVAISNPNVNPTSVDVVLGSATASNGSDFSYTSPTTVTFPGGSALVQVVTINIIDDAIASEGTENFTLNLSNPTNGAILVADSSITININDNDAVLSTIASIHTENMDGTSASIGTSVLVEGIVYGVNLRASSTGTQFTIIDNTGGIGVFNGGSTLGYTVTEGDKISLAGTVAQFNGFTQITADTIIVLSSGNPLKMPTMISSLSEVNESDLLELNADCWTILNPSSWNAASNPLGFNVNISNGSDTVILRIDNDVNIFTTVLTAPTGVSIKGIGGQFDNSSPYNSGYQILPRYNADLSTCVGIEEVQNIQSISPNPTEDIFNLSTTTEMQKVCIYDIQGKKVFEQNTFTSKNVSIDGSDWNAGVYMIYVQTKEGFETAKIVLQ